MVTTIVMIMIILILTIIIIIIITIINTGIHSKTSQLLQQHHTSGYAQLSSHLYKHYTTLTPFLIDCDLLLVSTHEAMMRFTSAKIESLLLKG